MSKKDLLQEGLKGGLNRLLSPTTSTSDSKVDSKASASAKPAKEKAVHCNFLIDKSIHTRMKYLAIEKEMSLREIVNVAMREYLERNEKKR